jgi:hypothetical protein
LIWQDWLISASTTLGVTTEQGGIMLSILVTLILSAIFTIATRGKHAPSVMMGTFTLGTVLFTFMGWFPTWTGSVIAILFALLFARTVSGGIFG